MPCSRPAPTHVREGYTQRTEEAEERYSHTVQTLRSPQTPVAEAVALREVLSLSWPGSDDSETEQTVGLALCTSHKPKSSPQVPQLRGTARLWCGSHADAPSATCLGSSQT